MRMDITKLSASCMANHLSFVAGSTPSVDGWLKYIRSPSFLQVPETSLPVLTRRTVRVPSERNSLIRLRYSVPFPTITGRSSSHLPMGGSSLMLGLLGGAGEFPASIVIGLPTEGLWPSPLPPTSPGF